MEKNKVTSLGALFLNRAKWRPVGKLINKLQAKTNDLEQAHIKETLSSN